MRRTLRSKLAPTGLIFQSIIAPRKQPNKQCEPTDNKPSFSLSVAMAIFEVSHLLLVVDSIRESRVGFAPACAHSHEPNDGYPTYVTQLLSRASPMPKPCRACDWRFCPTKRDEPPCQVVTSRSRNVSCIPMHFASLGTRLGMSRVSTSGSTKDPSCRGSSEQS